MEVDAPCDWKPVCPWELISMSLTFLIPLRYVGVCGGVISGETVTSAPGEDPGHLLGKNPLTAPVCTGVCVCVCSADMCVLDSVI